MRIVIQIRIDLLMFHSNCDDSSLEQLAAPCPHISERSEKHLRADLCYVGLDAPVEAFHKFPDSVTASQPRQNATHNKLTSWHSSPQKHEQTSANLSPWATELSKRCWVQYPACHAKSSSTTCLTSIVVQP